MKLYDFEQAPNPRRVHIYLAEKGLDLPLEGAPQMQVEWTARYESIYGESADGQGRA